MVNYSIYQLEAISVKVVKGNELAELITETHSAGEFQDTMANGRDRNKAIRVQKTVAALGARGDYILLVCDVAYTDGSTVAHKNGLPLAGNGLMVDILDFTGVPIPVQHGGFGRFSPFDTPKELITKELARGIDKQLLTIVPDNVFNTTAHSTIMSTALSQTIRGVADGRITILCDEADHAAVTKLYLKLKPNADGVFVIPAGALLWGKPELDKTAGANFGQVQDSD